LRRFYSLDLQLTLCTDRHYWLFNDLLVATKPIVAKGAKWRGKVFGSSSKKSGRGTLPSTSPQPTTPATDKPPTPRGSGSLPGQPGGQETGGEETVGVALEEGLGFNFRHMTPLRKCELRNVSDATAEKRWGRRNVFQLVNAEHSVLTFEASSPEDKDGWLQSLDEGASPSPPLLVRYLFFPP
jgi:hypothetical protein